MGTREGVYGAQQEEKDPFRPNVKTRTERGGGSPMNRKEGSYRPS